MTNRFYAVFTALLSCAFLLGALSRDCSGSIQNSREMLPPLRELNKWASLLNEAATTVSSDGPGLRIDTTKTDGTTWRAKLSAPIQLVPEKQYLFHAKVRASAPCIVPFVLIVDKPGFVPAGVLGDQRVTQTSKTINIVFRGLPAIETEGCHFEIWTGGQTGTVWIEELSIVPLPDQPFPAVLDASKWSLVTNEAEGDFSPDGSGIRITTSKTDGTSWRAKLLAPIRLKAGEEYLFHVRARASVPSSIPYVLVVDEPGFVPAGVLGEQKIGETAENMDVVFKGLPAIGDKLCYMEIWTGKQAGTVWIEELSITPKPAAALSVAKASPVVKSPSAPALAPLAPPAAPSGTSAMRSQRPIPPQVEQDLKLEARIAPILPTEEENSYRKIKWYTDLAEASRDARRQNKPIFFWLMNGHPLCDT